MPVCVREGTHSDKLLKQSVTVVSSSYIPFVSLTIQSVLKNIELRVYFGERKTLSLLLTLENC